MLNSNAERTPEEEQKVPGRRITDKFTQHAIEHVLMDAANSIVAEGAERLKAQHGDWTSDAFSPLRLEALIVRAESDSERITLLTIRYVRRLLGVDARPNSSNDE